MPKERKIGADRTVVLSSDKEGAATVYKIGLGNANENGASVVYNDAVHTRSFNNTSHIPVAPAKDPKGNEL